MSDIEIITYFADNLRSPLFGAFLTAGAFLLSMKTFIVVQVKQQIYDDEFYQSEFDEKNGDQLYGPLRRLSKVLFTGVLLCLFASFAQFTIGLFENIYCIYACLTLAIIASFSLVICVIFCHVNIKTLYVFSARKYDNEKSKLEESNPKTDCDCNE